MGWHQGILDCAKGVRIGVVGAGVNASHSALRTADMSYGVILREPTHVTDWHGTAMLGLLAGDPMGLIRGARLHVVEVFERSAMGPATTDLTTILAALDLLQAWGVQVVALNIVGPHDQLLRERIQALSARGMIFVAPVGDDGPDAPPNFPAAYPEVISVTAVDRNLRLYSRANRGQHIDVAAPGVDIVAAQPGDRQAAVSGTAFAATLVTAVVAALYPSLSQKTKADALRYIRFLPIADGRLVLAPTSCQG